LPIREAGLPDPRLKANAQVAQLVEQRTENPRVAGSIPALGTITSFKENMRLNETNSVSFAVIDMKKTDRH
jgi:hypothetical protein